MVAEIDSESRPGSVLTNKTLDQLSTTPGEENKASRLTLAINLDFLPSQTMVVVPGESVQSPGLTTSGS